MDVPAREGRRPGTGMPSRAAIAAAALLLLLVPAWGIVVARFQRVAQARLNFTPFTPRASFADFDRYIFGQIERQLLVGGVFHTYYFYDLMRRGDGAPPEGETVRRVSARVLVPYPTHADVVFRAGPDGEYRFRLSRNRDVPSGFYRYDGPRATLLVPLAIPAAMEGLDDQYDADVLARARRWNFWYPHRMSDEVLEEASDARWFELEVLLEEDRFVARVDGTEVGSAIDAAYPRGDVGWGTGAQPAVYWDWVEVESHTATGASRRFREEFAAPEGDPLLDPLRTFLSAAGAALLAALLTAVLLLAVLRGLGPPRALLLAGISWSLPLPLLAQPTSAWFLKPIEPTALDTSQAVAFALVLPLVLIAAVLLVRMRDFRPAAAHRDAGGAATRPGDSGVPRRLGIAALLVAAPVLVGAPLLFSAPATGAPWPREADGTTSPRTLPALTAAPGRPAEILPSGTLPGVLAGSLDLTPGALVDLTFARHADGARGGLTVWGVVRVERDAEGATRAALFDSEGYPAELEDMAGPHSTTAAALPIELAVRAGGAEARVGDRPLGRLAHPWFAAPGPVTLVAHRGTATLRDAVLGPVAPAPRATRLLPEGVTPRLWVASWRGRTLLGATLVLVCALGAVVLAACPGLHRAGVMLFLAGAALPATLLALQPWDPAARSAWWLASLVLPLAAAWYAVAAAVRGAAAFQFSLLLLVIVCAGLGEAALRVHPTSARLLRGDYAFGLHRSEYQFRPMEAPLIWPSYARTFDAFPGWRGASAGGAARIVCLGGSSTVGVGATSPALAYPAQLERMLREAGRGAVEVVNAGFLGYSSFDNWLLAARDLPALQPALVVLNFSANDGFPAWWLSRSQREVWESFRVAWEARARLPRLLASSRLLAGIFRQAGAVARPLRRHQGSLLVPPDDFERNVGEIIDRARAAGARVLLVAEPYYESTQPGEAYYSRYHDVLAGLAERRGVPLLRPSLTATEARRDKVFYDPVHPTDEGYRRIAEEIAAVIARDELLPAR